MSWTHSSSMHTTRSFRSSSLTTGQITTSFQSSTASLQLSTASLQTSSASTLSSTESIQSSASEKADVQKLSVQKLYLLLPNHKCPNKKTCPFHPPEEEEEELEEAEMTLVNKPRAMSLASHEDRMITEQILAEKLAKINQQISSNLVEGQKLHFPRKTSHDITLPTADLDRLRFDHSISETVPAPSSTREESVTSDYDLDSGVTFDSCSDRELDDDSLPLIQEEVIVPDIVLPAELKLKNEEEVQEVETTVQINEVSTVDSGTFTFQATSYAEEAGISATVAIEEPVLESHSKPQFVKELEYLTVTEGSLVRLECVVTGDPKPDIKWFKDNQRIDTNDSYKIQNDEDGTVTLIIEGAETKDSGLYMCAADNVAGSATTQSKIRVQKVIEEKPTPDVFLRPEDREVKKHQLLVPPEFTAKLKNKTAPEGVTVRLNCSVTGIPEPTYRWFKDDREIFDGPDYTQRKDGELLSLEIAGVKQSLAGKYTLEASNSEGRVSCSCILEVEGEEKIEAEEFDFLRPKFLRKIEDVYVSEGEDATFTCTATGKPMPAFKWQRDMINITASNLVEMESNNQGHAHLTLKKVKPSEGGLYYCVAQSKAGRTKCCAYLHVRAKSSSPVITKKEEEHVKVQARKESSVERGRMLGSPPSLVLMLPDTLDVVVGGRLKLDCSVQGYPIPLVTWHKGDRGLMYSQRHRIVPCGTLHTMEIPQVMALDKGEYIVRATNVHGTVQSSCYVNILPKGSKASPPDYRREAMVIAVKEGLQAPFFVKHLPQSIDAILGMNIRLDCILREGIELVKWSKSQSPLQDLEKAKKELVDEGFHGEFIPLEARSHDQPVFLSEDKTQADTVKNRPSGKEEKQSERPSFTTAPKDMVRHVGSEAVFECSTSGSPEPEIKWYRDGKLLTASSRLKISTTGSKHTLRITDLRISDEGEYVCKADNLAGTNTCGAVLAVVADFPESKPSKTQPAEQEVVPTSDNQKKEEPARQEKHETLETYERPSFKQALPKTTSARHGDTVELVCQLTSSDVASIKWELDGIELSKEARYHLSSDDSSNQHKLTIHSVTENDSAKYTCVVYLKDGDLVHTSTKLIVSAAKPKPQQKDEDFKPHFTTMLKDTVVKDGEGLILECDIEGNPRPQISWLRDGVEIFDSEDFQISTIGCHCKLQINDIYPEDEGRYSCRAINNIGEAVSACYVTVEDLGGDISPDSASTTSSRSYEKTRARRGETEDIKKKAKKEQEKPEVPPELVVKPRRQFIDDGSNAKFKASFDGSDKTILFWSKDGHVLKEDDHFKMYEADGFHFLEVQKVSVEDAGMYSVTVQNLVGSDTAEAELEVFEKPKLLTRSGPEWQQTLQDLTVEEGDNGVELVCTCKELTQPSVRWFHNGKEIVSGFHIKLHHVAQTATLTIKEIKELDAGEFKCVMTGKNGELETSCVLNIGSPEKMEPPVFVTGLHDMEVDEGDKLELDVEVKGLYPVRVSWYHNNMEITPDNPLYLIDSVSNVHTLTLLHATSETSGEYVCEAYNDSGSTDTFCFIEVREVEHPEPPEFVTHPLNISAHEGETATFTCQVKGQPMPSVLWKKGGVAIATNQKFKITRIHDYHTLTVYNTDYTDAGEYTCFLYNTEGSMTYICRLHVADHDYSQEYQTADSLKLRSSHPQDVQWMPQSGRDSTAQGQQPSSSSEISRGQRQQRMLRVEDGNEDADVLTTNTGQETSFETIFRATATATKQLTAVPHHVDGETREHNLHHHHQPHSNDSNNIPQSEYKKPMKVTKVMNENSPQLFSGFEQNLPQAVTNFQSASNKIHQKAEESRNVTDSNPTDFRSVLKHRQMSPLAQSGKSYEQSNNIDFRTVLSQNKAKEFKGNKFESAKGGMGSSELNNTPVAQTSKTDLSNSVESSQIVRQGWRRTRNFDSSSSSSFQQFEEVSNTEELKIIASSRTGKENAVTEGIKPCIVLVKNNNLPGSLDFSEASTTTDDGAADAIKMQDSSETFNTKIGNTLFRSDTQVVDTRAYEGRAQDSGNFSPTEHFKVFLNPPSSAIQSQNGSDIHHKSENDHPAMESEKMTLKYESQKMNLLQLSARKVSISEYNPSAPKSEALQLEITSVSASVPPRQSLSSPKTHSRPSSVTVPVHLGHLAAANSDMKSEDDDVFTDISRKRASSHPETEQNFRSDEVKHNLNSFGSVFTWEKTPWDSNDVKKNTVSENSVQDNVVNQTNDITEKQINRSRIRFSENIQRYHDHGHEGRRSASRFSAVSKNETGSCLDTSAQDSNKSAAVTDSTVDDFRNVRLKPAAPRTRAASELSRSKFMSKSTESVFTDVTLKPVAKTNDAWRKSEISSNAERIKTSSKSSDFSKLFSNFSYQNSTRSNPTPRTTSSAASTASKFSSAASTTSKFSSAASTASTFSSAASTASKFSPTASTTLTFSDSQKTFSGDAKPKSFLQNSRKSVQSSKFRTPAGKYEKASPGGVSRTNSHRKSRGIGAKFEAAIKDLTNTKQVPYTSLQISRKNQGDVKPSVQQTSTAYSSRKTSDDLQHQKAAEAVPSEKGLKKTVNAVGKLNSNNSLMNSGSESYKDKVSDWVKKRHSLQTGNSAAFASDKSIFRGGEKLPRAAGDALGNFEVDKKNLETNGLNKTNIAPVPNTAQDVKTDWLSRKLARGAEARVRARSRTDNQQDTPEFQWVSLRSPQDSMKGESMEDSKRASQFEFGANYRTTPKDQQAVTYSTNATKFPTTTAVNTVKKSSEIRNMETFPESLPEKSDLCNYETVSYKCENVPDPASLALNPANDGARTSEIYKTTVILTPKIAASPSTALTTSTTSAAKVKLVSSTALLTNAVESVSSIVIPKVSVTSASATTEIKMSSSSWKRSGDTENKLEGPEVENASHISAHSSKGLKGSEGKSFEGSASDYSPQRQSSVESQSDSQQSSLKNTRHSWMKQKSQRHIPVYPVNDTEMSPYSESLKLSMDDSESVLSTASMSSSSSDASNVTVDSGYTRNQRRRHPGRDRIHPASEAWQHENNEKLNKIANSSELNDGVRNHLSEVSETEINFCVPSRVKENNDAPHIQSDQDKNAQTNLNLTTDLRYNQGQISRLREEATGEISTTAAPEDSSKQREPDSKLTGTYDDEITSMYFKQTRSRWRNLNEGQALESADVLKDSESLFGVKRNELPDLTNDSDVPRYISRRQRRQLENNVAASGSTLKSETEETGKVKLSKSYISDISTNCLTSNRHEKMSVSHENRLAEQELVRTVNTDSGQIFPVTYVKSDCTNSEQALSLELDKPASNFGHEYRKYERGIDITRTVKKGSEIEPENERKWKSRGKEEQINLGQGESVSAIRRVDSTSDETAKTQMEPSVRSSSNLNQNWRSSRLQHREASMDKKIVPSNVSHQDEIRLSKSGVEATSSVLTTSALPSATHLTNTTSLAALIPRTLTSPSEETATERQQPNCPPSFPMPLHDASVMYGSKAVLQCQVTGNPRPDVKWLLNQKRLEPSENIEIIYSGVIAQVTVTETSREHAGDYTCWARNSLGTVSSHCALSVEDDHTHIVTDSNTRCRTTKAVSLSNTGEMSACLSNNTRTDHATTNMCTDGVPEAPVGRPDVYIKNGNSACLSWHGPTCSEGNQVIYYLVEAKMVKERSWDVVIPQCKELTCLIEGLRPSTEYQFRVLAANRHGVSPPSEPSETVITSDPVTLTSDFKCEGDLPFVPREVVINTKDKFEDLYQVEKEVGRGKFGVVYKCKQNSDGTIWAAKVVRCREKEKIALRREVDIMNKLHHPKLLLLWDAFESQRQMVLVMEYVAAGELFERVIDDDYVLTENDCIHFVRQICDGVAHMHNSSILHLDLKPENILCVAENSNRIKIIDFGLAQFYKPGQSIRVMFGTPEFIAPEVINYEEISFMTDMWSLGVICYVLLSGLSPFAGDSEAETLANVTKGEYDFDDEAFDEISDLAKDFISQLLVMKKEKRILTGRCLAHPWLNQDEVDGVRGKRLNTERLKKFMVRRKWLKTGNAVKAVGRLLKSNSLTGPGAFNHSISNDSMPDTPLPSTTPVSILQRTAEEAVDDEEDQSVSISEETYITPDTSKNLGHAPSDPVADSFGSLEENFSSTKYQRNVSKIGASSSSQWKTAAHGETLTNSAEKTSVSLLTGITLEGDKEYNSNIDEVSSHVINSSSQNMAQVFDLNQDVGKSASKSVSGVSRQSLDPQSSRVLRQSQDSQSSSVSRVSKESQDSQSLSVSEVLRQSHALLSSPASAHKNSIQTNNRKAEVKQISGVGHEGAVPKAPVFTKSMIRCKTYAGDVARFDVVVSGNPLPQVTWFFEDEEIHSDSRYTLNSNEKTRAFSLVIRNIEEEDEGEYKCKAVNSQGECTCVAELVVLEL